jgi:hypothetical protein
LDLIVNNKLGCFPVIKIVHGNRIISHLKLKTLPRFCPISPCMPDLKNYAILALKIIDIDI